MEPRSANQTDTVGAHAVDVRGYMMVFGALMVLTLVTVGASYLELTMTPAILLAVAIAVAKAALVALFFMHLKTERPLIYWSLGLTAFLFVALFASLLWSEGDHLFGTRFDDAFDDGRAPAAQSEGGAH